ncbi:MAG TPA: hypothetical protein VJR89_43280, partial [Polyangiales bacterium]|nr:hypothetical protein [Polyangiales bacterium]
MSQPSAQDRQRVRDALDRSIARGAASQTVLRVDASMAMRALGVPEPRGFWSSKAGLTKLLLPVVLVGSGIGALWWPQSEEAQSSEEQAAPIPLRVEDIAPLDRDPIAAPQLPAAGTAPLAKPSSRPAARSTQVRSAAHHAPLHALPARVAPEPEAAPTPQAAPATPHFDPPPASHHLAEELRLMRAASAALAANDAPGALRILADHARRFP